MWSPYEADLHRMSWVHSARKAVDIAWITYDITVGRHRMSRLHVQARYRRSSEQLRRSRQALEWRAAHNIKQVSRPRWEVMQLQCLRNLKSTAQRWGVYTVRSELHY